MIYNCESTVRKTLKGLWKQECPFPKKKNKEEGIQALASLVLKKIESKISTNQKKLTSERTKKEETEKYVDKVALIFSHITATRFSFSEFPQEELASILKIGFKKESRFPSFLASLLLEQLKKECSEEKLAPFTEKIKTLSFDEIRLACIDLFSRYEYGNMRGGFAFLWLVKTVSKGEITLPPLETFDKTTVGRSLSFNKVAFDHPDKFASLLFTSYCEKRPLLSHALPVEKQAEFLIFVEFLLKNNAFKNRERRSEIIVSFLEFSEGDESFQRSFASSLKQNPKEKIQKIGEHVLAMIDLNKERNQHLEELSKLLPTLKVPSSSKKSQAPEKHLENPAPQT